MNGGASLSAQTLLIDPFADGRQFLINMPMRFIALLFFAEGANVVDRIALTRAPSSARKKIGIMLAYLLAGGAVVIGVDDEGLPAGPLLLVCRTSFFLACLGVGRCYSAVMEKRDKFAKYALFCHPASGLNLSHCCLGRLVCLR